LAANALQEAIEDGLSMSPNANKKATTTQGSGDGLFSVPPLSASKDSGATAKERETGASVLVRFFLFLLLTKTGVRACAMITLPSAHSSRLNFTLLFGKLCWTCARNSTTPRAETKAELEAAVILSKAVPVPVFRRLRCHRRCTPAVCC
jgi:hypothetical protein